LSHEQISDFPAASRLHATVKDLNVGIPGISASTIRKITARQSEAPLYTPNAKGEITPTVEPALATPASPSPYNHG
jgi:hypothetical protein